MEKVATKRTARRVFLLWLVEREKDSLVIRKMRSNETPYQPGISGEIREGKTVKESLADGAWIELGPTFASFLRNNLEKKGGLIYIGRILRSLPRSEIFLIEYHFFSLIDKKALRRTGREKSSSIERIIFVPLNRHHRIVSLRNEPNPPRGVIALPDEQFRVFRDKVVGVWSNTPI